MRFFWVESGNIKRFSWQGLRLDIMRGHITTFLLRLTLLMGRSLLGWVSRLIRNCFRKSMFLGKLLPTTARCLAKRLKRCLIPWCKLFVRGRPMSRILSLVLRLTPTFPGIWRLRSYWIRWSRWLQHPVFTRSERILQARIRTVRISRRSSWRMRKST